MRRKENVTITFVIGLLITAVVVVTCFSWAIIDAKNKVINDLQSQIVSLQEENRDVMNLYAEMQEEEQFDTSNEDEFDQKYFSLERRIRFLYDKMNLDYNSDFYKGELKSE